MALCFEEKDRAVIESKYDSIIAFKRDLYAYTRVSAEALKIVYSHCQSLVDALQAYLIMR